MVPFHGLDPIFRPMGCTHHLGYMGLPPYIGISRRHAMYSLAQYLAFPDIALQDVSSQYSYEHVVLIPSGRVLLYSTRGLHATCASVGRARHHVYHSLNVCPLHRTSPEQDNTEHALSADRQVKCWSHLSQSSVDPTRHLPTHPIREPAVTHSPHPYTGMEGHPS